MREKRHNKLWISVLLISIAVLIGVAGYLVVKQMMTETAEQTTEQVQSDFAPALQGLTMPDITEETDPRLSLPDAPDNPVDFEGLMKLNPEVYSWVYVPDTNISLPVLRSKEDDNYYLDHDVYKNYSFPGAIYSQSMNKLDYSDRVTVLYGHNMSSGSMFANLHEFEDQDFFDNHEFFYVFTKDRRLTYQVISAHEYDSKHILNSYNFKDDKVFKEWLAMAQNPRTTLKTVRKGVQLDLNSKILVLSTCANGNDGRYLLQGVLVSDDRI